MPTKLLQKSGPLSDDEFAAIQRHPLRGLDIVREIAFLREAVAGILHHHERIDGRGYPMGLQGGDIPEFARIIAVADAFDSMTSTWSCRSPQIEIADLNVPYDSWLPDISCDGMQPVWPGGSEAAQRARRRSRLTTTTPPGDGRVLRD